MSRADAAPAPPRRRGPHRVPAPSVSARASVPAFRCGLPAGEGFRRRSVTRALAARATSTRPSPSASSGLDTRARCCVETCRYRVVFRIDRCPSSTWMVRRSSPASSRWVANEWRKACIVTRRPMPERSGGAVDRAPNGVGAQRLAPVLARKQQRSWRARQSPVLAQGLEQASREHHQARDVRPCRAARG